MFVGDNHFALVGWTTTSSYDNVRIQANLYTTAGSLTSFTAYLTNQVGAGATSVTQVATATPTAPVWTNPLSPATLFSGLSLGPGTYYLVLSPSSTQTGILWDSVGLTAVPPTLAPGVTLTQPALATPTFPNLGDVNSSYPPASNFSQSFIDTGLVFSVTGDLVAGGEVPEPSAFALVLGGLALLGMRRRVQ